MTPERLRDVILGDTRHKYYITTVKEADHLSFHIEGYEYDYYREKRPLEKFDKFDPLNYDGNTWFDIIIGDYRPEESKDSKAYEYRIKTYKAITKSTCSKVINELQKITRSSDWSIKFPEKDSPLEEYLNNYPKWNNFTNFLQSVVVKKTCLDPNGLAVVIPDNLPLTEIEAEMMDDTELLNPVVRFFESKHVLDYIEDEYAICYDEDDFYFVFTKEAIERYQNTDKGVTLTMRWEYPSELRKLNARKLKGIYSKSNGKNILYDSFLSPMLPYLDKAARESSDLDASTVRAMFPQAWQVAGLNCKRCNGSGKLRPAGLAGGQPVVCSDCGGLGSVAHSPSQVITVKQDPLATGQQIPIPPKGFIEPGTGIIQLQKDTIKEHKIDALSALNFQYLDQTPLNESGKAKEVDRDSQHNFIQKVAETLVETANFMIFCINEIRYGKEANRDRMLPVIHVPEDFSIITAEAYLAEMEKAKLSGASVSTKKEIEREFIRKRWRNDREERKRCLAYIDLNPAYGIEVGQIVMSELDPTDKIIALNVIQFVDRAIEEDPSFIDMEMMMQYEIMARYAEEKIPAPAEVEEDEG